MERLLLCSINARTLSSPSYLLEFEEALEKICWDVCAVCEARMAGSGTFTLTKSNSVVYYSGGPTAHRGVCFIVSPQHASRASFKPHSDRLATLRLPMQRLYLVAAYAPTSAAPDQEFDEFIELVERVIRHCPYGYTPVLMGDFNARVSRQPGNESVIGLYSSPDSNPRGDSFAEMCTRLKLRVWNTFFKCRSGRRWTWRSPNGATFAQIDFIAAPLTAKVCHCSVLNRFEFNTDHRMLRIAICVGGRKTTYRTPRTRPLLDSSVYRADSDLLATVATPPPRNANEAYWRMAAFAETAATNSWTRPDANPWISPATRRLLA